MVNYTGNKTIASEILNKKGMVSNIERYAINDGFGLRTTVFLKGCPLRCKWCSNPETQKFNCEMVFFEDQCIGCGECVKLCRYGALDNGLKADRSICDKCYLREDAFSCTLKCYPQCRKIDGQEMTVKEVFDVVKRDIQFYHLSGGGVTISGGEPLAQPEFTLNLLQTFKQNYINTAIETCGYAREDDYEAIAPYLDMAFMDLKSADTVKHEEWTGASNASILNNIIVMDELSKEYGFDFIIRTPVIPGFNDSAHEIQSIGKFVTENCKNYKGMELLPYHKLGRGKYISLGRIYELEGLKAPSDEQMNELHKILINMGINLYQF
ncbi:glycyl-radical enzyme activating protein [Lachnospiraceae bacterium MD1]|jgi:pyruvate formate lyase activating enzyme|uniref:Glycyl-radical enzyme activating protein n=1 Tax=Variimorphobacter saccharofermentans TaxID=2755051 RepID=A0A839JXJ7_9FIRM|nr:glycyl-radical enzyme activating protein [Variimorphobacter saccharofermentans]MBB2182126.1 glycyl-radical enzyme activating protein [Variimorphobacter saccharofermentans]